MKISILIIVCICFLSINVLEAMKVTQPAVLVASRHGKVALICGYNMTGKVEEIRFSLLKRKDNEVTEICVFSYTTHYEQFVIGDGIQCEGQPGPNNVSVQISGLQTTDSGMFFCRVEVMYPPPYRISQGYSTLIYVSDFIPEAEKLVESAEEEEPPNFQLYEWVLIVMFLSILLYSAIVTGLLLISKQRRRKWNTGYYQKVLETDQEKRASPYYIRI